MHTVLIRTLTYPSNIHTHVSLRACVASLYIQPTGLFSAYPSISISLQYSNHGL